MYRAEKSGNSVDIFLCSDGSLWWSEVTYPFKKWSTAPGSLGDAENWCGQNATRLMGEGWVVSRSANPFPSA